MSDVIETAGRTQSLVVQSDEMRWMTVPREDMLATLRQSLYPGATDLMIIAVMDYCKAAGLNVMLRPVHIVPMYVPAKTVEAADGTKRTIPGGMRDVIMPGINHYRVQAARTQRYLGLTQIEWGPIIKPAIGIKDFEVPEFARVAAKVRVGDDIVEFWAEEYWMECYATKARDSKEPNAMWAKRARGQLAKTVEAQALRKAFPELGDYTAEEMEGKVIDLVRDADGTHRADPATKPTAAANSNLDAFAGGAAPMKQAKTAARGAGGNGPAASGATTNNAAKSDVSDQSSTSGRDHTQDNANDAFDKDEQQAGKVELPGPDADTGEILPMPADAMKAWIETQKWSKGWRWINEVMPTLGPKDRQALCEAHAPLLRAVYGTNAAYKKAATEFVQNMGVTVPAAAEGGDAA
jgi:phage recombination protein Bet